MEFKTYEYLEDPSLLKAVYDLVVLGDKEFIPPLSSRSSTTQQTLAGASGNGIDSYFEEMKKQSFVLAFEEGKVAGFMSFRENYENDHLPKGENLYASTCVVHPDFRGRGMMRGFYEAMIALYPDRDLYTRTWHTNYPHLKVLDRLGFAEIVRLPNHRGPGMDTVYFCRKADR